MKENDDTYPDDELMEDYILGIIDIETRAALELRIANDPAVAEKVELHRKIVQTQQFARKQQLRKQFLDHFAQREQNEPLSPLLADNQAKKKVLTVHWAAAAILLLAFSTVAFWAGDQMATRRAMQNPVIIRDTVFVGTPSKGGQTPLDTSGGRKFDPGGIKGSNKIDSTKFRQIAAFVRRPEKGKIKERGVLIDTLDLIEIFWKEERFIDVIRVADLYQQNKQSRRVLELYADALFKTSNYAQAEKVYFELTKYASRQEAKWNLLVCYALQYQTKKTEFDTLVKEIDQWKKPNDFEKDLENLSQIVKKQ